MDQRKLKTPNGSNFVVNSEVLALGVASEWDAQKDQIDRSCMHLTSLCNTVIDNPNKLQKTDMINYLLNYIQTDTILFHASTEEPRLQELQQKEWGTILNWFNYEFATDLKPTTDIVVPTISNETKLQIGRYLRSYNEASLHGFVYAVDTLKSLVLAVACIKQKLSVEMAVHYSRLEEEFQLGYWGRVEWAHDLNQQDLESRLAASCLFIIENRKV